MSSGRQIQTAITTYSHSQVVALNVLSAEAGSASEGYSMSKHRFIFTSVNTVRCFHCALVAVDANYDAFSAKYWAVHKPAPANWVVALQAKQGYGCSNIPVIPETLNEVQP